MRRIQDRYFGHDCPDDELLDSGDVIDLCQRYQDALVMVYAEIREVLRLSTSWDQIRAAERARDVIRGALGK